MSFPSLTSIVKVTLSTVTPLSGLARLDSWSQHSTERTVAFVEAKVRSVVFERQDSTGADT